MAEGALVHLAHVTGSKWTLQVLVERGVRLLLLRLLDGVVVSVGVLHSVVASLQEATRLFDVCQHLAANYYFVVQPITMFEGLVVSYRHRDT